MSTVVAASRIGGASRLILRVDHFVICRQLINIERTGKVNRGGGQQNWRRSQDAREQTGWLSLIAWRRQTVKVWSIERVQVVLSLSKPRKAHVEIT